MCASKKSPSRRNIRMHQAVDASRRHSFSSMRVTSSGSSWRGATSFDKLIDLECGWNADVKRALLVRTGYGAEVEKHTALKNAVVVNDLPAAAAWILESSQ